MGLPPNNPYFVKCAYPDCQKKVVARGYCRQHYQRLLKSGELKIIQTQVSKKIKHFCGVEGCVQKYFGKGYCRRHYMQIRHHGRILEEGECRPHIGRGKCRTDGCEKFRHRSGLCSSCYKKQFKKRVVEYMGNKCSICGYNRCLEALELHHVDAKTKEGNIADFAYKSWEDVLVELSKCIIVCANCHRETHFQCQPIGIGG